MRLLFPLFSEKYVKGLCYVNIVIIFFILYGNKKKTRNSILSMDLSDSAIFIYRDIYINTYRPLSLNCFNTCVLKYQFF